MAGFPIAMMRRLVDWMAELPGSDLPLPALPIVVVILFYALLALALLPATRRSFKILARGGPATACAALLFLPFLAGLGASRNAGDHLRLTLLSVGAGQCAVVELPSGKTVLIDAGSSTVQDLPRRCLEPFLRRRGVGSVDAIYVSHANLDHFSAVARAAREYDVRRVVVTTAFEAHAIKNAPARQTLADLRAGNVPLAQVSAGETIPLDDSTTLQVLWPPTGAQVLSPNDTSQVLKLTCGGRSILFTGDVQQPALESLLRNPAALSADVLIAPHHGSAEPAPAAFLTAPASPPPPPASSPTSLLPPTPATPDPPTTAFPRPAAGPPSSPPATAPPRANSATSTRSPPPRTAPCCAPTSAAPSRCASERTARS